MTLPERLSPQRRSKGKVPSAAGRVTARLAVLAAGLLALLPGALNAPVSAAEVRIKDIVDIDGVRSNHLVGMGLVVGLNNTGGKTPVTRRFASNMLQQFGLRLDPELRQRIQTDTTSKTNNLSVVTVTAELPAFRRPGQSIDVVVSAFDDAQSLTGGQLVLTPLFGVDDEVYAVASGPVSVDAFSVSGDAASVQKNHPTSGRIPGGAIVEQAVCTTIAHDGVVRLLLREPDFTTADRIVAAVNQWRPRICRAADPATIEILAPHGGTSELTSFLAAIGGLTVVPDARARVVINERTGTIVIGSNVRLSRALITHANLAIFTQETPQVSQPAPLGDGDTVVVPRTDIEVVEEDRAVEAIDDTATVGDLAQALNALGIPPRDLAVIFQQLQDSGALHAELEFK